MFLRKKLFSVILAFFLLFQSTVMSMDQQKPPHHRDAIISDYNVDVGEVKFSDPPFYLIETEDNKIIYVLGAMHPLPVTKALSLKAYEELTRIANSKPLFITEHSDSNEVNLSMIDQAPTPGNWIENDSIETDQRELFKKIENDHIKLDMNHTSNIPVSKLKEVNPWLALPILTLHVGSQLKKVYGSFEHSIITLWGKTLLPEHHLEEHGETLRILEASGGINYIYYIKGLNYFLKLLPTVNYQDPQSQILWKVKFKEYIENYSCTNFDGDNPDIPTVERNHAWVKVFLEKYYKMHNTFLIVIGTAHLEGSENFIKLLLKSGILKGKIKRFSNDEGWIHF